MSDIPLLRNSEREDFRRCPQRWWWRWQEGLVPVEFSTGPLVFGTFGHLALAEYYQPGFKRGPHPAETWDKLTQEYTDGVKTVVAQDSSKFFDDELEMKWEDARNLGHDILVNYVEEYDGDPGWEVLWTEHQFNQPIPHPFYPEKIINRTVHRVKENRPIVNYVGTIDLIVRDHRQNGRIRYIDHKFLKSIETDHLHIDSQNGGYLAIGTHQLRREGIIGLKESVRDLIYNFVRKARPPDKRRNALGEYLNQDGSVSKRQPPPFFVRYNVTKTAAERNQQITHIGNEALAMKAFKDGNLPLYKSPKRDCRWDCSFFNLCIIHETGGNVEETKKMLFRKENPYAEYENAELSQKKLKG